MIKLALLRPPAAPQLKGLETTDIRAPPRLRVAEGVV